MQVKWLQNNLSVENVPHADYLGLQSAFLKAEISPDNIHFFTVVRNK